jgi:hypothetical protein
MKNSNRGKKEVVKVRMTSLRKEGIFGRERGGGGSIFRRDTCTMVHKHTSSIRYR